MREDILRIFEGPEFGAAGTDPKYPRKLTEIGINPRVRYAIDGRDILTFSVPDTPDMRSLIVARKVVRLSAKDEQVSEWLVSRTTQAAGPDGSGMMQVECDPLRVVLADAGILEFIEQGQTAYANLGGLNGSARNYLATFVLPHLARRGYTWIEIGQIDSSIQFSFSWDAFTATQLIEALAREIGAEWQLRRDEANNRYVIDMVDRISGVIADVEAKEGLNILTLVRQRNRERLFTSIRPSGQLGEGEQERSTLGFNAWRVTAVSGDNVSVAPHQGGIGAIIEDGQHVGLYLEAANGTYHEIEGSVEATQTFELGTGAGASFAVNDDVAIVADNQGTLITSVESPSGIAQFGFVQAQSTSKHLGYRNYVKNPSFTVPSLPSNVLVGRVNTGGTSFTADLKDLPPNLFIPRGTRILIEATGGVCEATGADATTDGSGNLTVGMARNTPWGPPNTAVWLFLYPDIQPAPWTLRITGGTASVNGGAYPLIPVPAGPEVNQTATVGAAIIDRAWVNLSGLPANFVIPAGTSFGGDQRWVLETAQADGSGNAAVKVFTKASIAFPTTTVTLRRPALLRSGVGFLILKSADGAFGSQQGEPLGQTIGWVNRGPYYLNVDFTTYSDTVSSNINWSPTRTSSDRVVGPRLVSGEPVLTDPVQLNFDATYTAYRRSITATGTLSTGATALSVRLPHVQDLNTDQGTSFWIFNRATWTVGDSPRPFVIGSEATRIFQDGQLALLASRQWPATYTARLSEIVSEWGLDPNSPALDLGSFIRVRSPSVGIDTILRVVAIEYDPTEPSEKTFVLDSDPERISTLASRARPRPVFVDLNVEVVSGRVRETILVDESPPVIAEGAERFIVPAGEDAPTTDAPLAVSPLPADLSLIL